jgi:hypothetical protein
VGWQALPHFLVAIADLDTIAAVCFSAAVALMHFKPDPPSNWVM